MSQVSALLTKKKVPSRRSLSKSFRRKNLSIGKILLNGPRFRLFRYLLWSVLSLIFTKEDNDESELDSEESSDEEDENSIMLTEEEESCGSRLNIYIF